MAPTERRKRREVRKTITQILEEIQTTADLYYSGDFDRHILEIFSKLPDTDKTTFLRRSFELHWKNQIALAQSGLEDVLVVSGEERLRIDPVSIDLEKKKLDLVSKYASTGSYQMMGFAGPVSGGLTSSLNSSLSAMSGFNNEAGKVGSKLQQTSSIKILFSSF